jgi:hypothetical protein
VNTHPIVVRLSLILGGLLFVGSAAFATQDMDAACGGPFNEHWLDEYDAYADDVVLGRLIELDSDGLYHFETLTVYRGSVVSPIDGGDVAGTCFAPQPGGRFVYVAGDKRFGRYDLIFPHMPKHGWMVQPPDGYRSLDGLLALIGVLPDTSTSAPLETPAGEAGLGLGAFIVALLAFVATMILPSRTRPSLLTPSDIQRR